jgi:hypothetical protein
MPASIEMPAPITQSQPMSFTLLPPSTPAVSQQTIWKFNVALGIDAQGFCMIKAHQAAGS